MLLKDHPNHLKAIQHVLKSIDGRSQNDFIVGDVIYLGELLRLERNAVHISSPLERLDHRADYFFLYHFPTAAWNMDPKNLPADIRLDLVMRSFPWYFPVDQDGAAAFCEVDRRTIQRWGAKVKAPLQPIKFGRLQIYDTRWLFDFMRQNRKTPPNDPFDFVMGM